MSSLNEAFAIAQKIANHHEKAPQNHADRAAKHLNAAALHQSHGHKDGASAAFGMAATELHAGAQHHRDTDDYDVIRCRDLGYTHEMHENYIQELNEGNNDGR